MSAEGKKRVAHKPSHPSFHDLVVEAIAGLHERDGSSVTAIRKFVDQKYGDKLKGNWVKLLSNATKKAVDSGDLVRQKASYKLGDELKHKHNAKKPAKVRQLQSPRYFPTIFPRPRRAGAAARARAAAFKRLEPWLTGLRLPPLCCRSRGLPRAPPSRAR